MPLALKYRAAARTISTQLDLIVPRIATMQATYIAKHGRYLQLLPTHAKPPVDGSPKAPDRRTRTIKDRRRRKLVPDGVDANGDPKSRVEIIEDDSWVDVQVATPNTVSIAVYDYDGPLGKGYVVMGSIMVGADTVTATRPVGPETYRADTVEVTNDGR